MPKARPLWVEIENRSFNPSTGVETVKFIIGHRQDIKHLLYAVRNVKECHDSRAVEHVLGNLLEIGNKGAERIFKYALKPEADGSVTAVVQINPPSWYSDAKRFWSGSESDPHLDSPEQGESGMVSGTFSEPG